MKNPWQTVLGQERLWVVFWLYCVLGLAVFLLFLFTSDVSSSVMANALSVALLLYLLWAHYSLWTCAFNTQRRAWGYAARIYACVILAGVSLSTLVNIKSGSVDVLSVQ